MAQTDPRLLAVAVLLVRAAQERRIVTYSEIADEVECHHRTDMTRFLDQISEQCKAGGYPPLTALAVRKEDLTPSAGLWKFFPDVTATSRDKEWASMLRKVFQFDEWGELIKGFPWSEEEQ